MNEKDSTTLFQALFNDMAEGVALHEIEYNALGEPVNYRITEVNQRYSEILSMPKEQVIGRLATDAYGTSEPPYLKAFSDVVRTGVSFRFITYFPPLDKHFHISVSALGANAFATIFFDQTEQVKNHEQLKSAHEELQAQHEELTAGNEELMALYSQLTAAEKALREKFDELKSSKEELAQQEERFRLALEASHDIIYDRDMKTGVVIWSGHWEDRLGFSLGESGTTVHAWESSIHPDDRQKHALALADHLAGKTDMFQVEYRVLAKDGTYFWVSSRGKVLLDKKGKTKRLVGSLSDITEDKRREEKIRYMAYHDALTNLPNRMCFLDSMRDLFAKQEKGYAPGTLFFLDMDNFKMVNDSLGHASGDNILVEFSRRLRAQVDEGNFLARLGGDEFVVFVPGAMERPEVQQLVRNLLQILETPFDEEGQRIFLNASVGIANCPMHGDTPAILLRNADTALHEVKGTGKNNWRFFDESMQEAVHLKLQLETSLREALLNQELLLHYQPEFDLRTGKICGFEALLRWYRPEYGLVAPMTFIPIAEETGLIVPIGEWVLRQACGFAQTIRRTGRDDVQVAVNVSVRQLIQEDFIEMVSEILTQTELPSKLLEIEITESMLMEEFEANVRKLSRLREAGIQIALDDFGTGYSSLTYLRRLPINKLKIDKAFVADVSNGHTSLAILGSIIQMAHQMGLTVAAEGVEDDKQRDILRERNCDLIQGYLVGRPMPEQEALKLLIE